MINKFNRDLQTGQYFENELLKHIEYNSYSKAWGYFPYYDISILDKDLKEIKIEVKADYYIHKTNNIAIEYERRDKNSGINITTADYWAIFEYIDFNDKSKYTLYYIPTDNIKQYIKDCKYHNDVKGGDFKASKLYLFDKNLFKDYILYTNI